MAIFFQEREVLEKPPLEDFSLKPSIVQTMTKKMETHVVSVQIALKYKKILILT